MIRHNDEGNHLASVALEPAKPPVYAWIGVRLFDKGQPLVTSYCTEIDFLSAVNSM
jgi:hypothetical protein